MRIAVLGVGLIGGSIGLAARRRLDAELVGFDPDPATLERGIELEALDRGAATVAEATEQADAVFCAAPVGALVHLAREALDTAPAQAVISDVGSVKRGLAAELSGDERFIGGHPLAGAETSGVENAREDLFDGARWYLTPTGESGGLAYDRLQRLVAGIGARPQAIDPDEHDRLMATVSHLPHVIADVLANEAAAQLGGGEGADAEIGPSLRDGTRVAGSNPAIWGDILAANSEAVAAAAERAAARLGGGDVLGDGL